MTGSEAMNAIEKARVLWGQAAAIQGFCDPAWLRANRVAIVARLVARGVARPDAEGLLTRKLAAAEGALRTVATGGDHHAA